MLTRFWIAKFVRIFLIASVILVFVERVRGGSDYRSVFLWAAVAGIVSASLATVWAYTKSCELPPRG